jgi:hypothetical protein
MPIIQPSKDRNQELPYLGSLQFGGPGGTATLKHQVKNNVMVEIITDVLFKWNSGSLILTHEMTYNASISWQESTDLTFG